MVRLTLFSLISAICSVLFIMHCFCSLPFADVFCCRVRYRDPLGTMGALGRECRSLPLLTSLLEGRTARLHSHIQRSVSQGNRWASLHPGPVYSVR